MTSRWPCWRVCACIGLTAAVASHADALRTSSGLAQASAPVQQIHQWIVDAGDHHALPFLVVDKLHATVHVFNAHADWVGSAPALLGAARGDASAADIGDRALQKIRSFEKTTPAGRFESSLDYNLAGDLVLWVDYASAVSLHPLRSVSAKEHRYERLISLTPLDNRISYGCINVLPAFFDEIVRPQFSQRPGIVYVLPETRSWKSVFLKSTSQGSEIVK